MYGFDTTQAMVWVSLCNPPLYAQLTIESQALAHPGGTVGIYRC
jgi:hypothetical protein